MTKRLLLWVGLAMAILPQFVFAQDPSGLPAPASVPQKQQTFLGINLEALDVGVGYSLRLKTIEGVLTTPVLDISGVVEAPLGIVRNSNNLNVVGGLDINLLRLVGLLPSRLGVAYKLPGSLLVGCLMGYDLGIDKLDAIPHVVYRLTF